VSQKTTTAPDNETLKKLTKQIDVAFEEVAKLSGSNLPPTDFYHQMVTKVIEGIGAVAGAVWLRTPQGFLQLQNQVNIDKVGLDEKKGGRQTHNELLRRAFQGNRPMMLEPYGRVGGEDGPLAANMTEYLVILAPVLMDEGQPIGLLEIWQEPYVDTRIHPTFMNYVVQMAGYASNYNRNAHMRKSSNQEQVWTQLETFTKTIHSSLNPTEVAFQIANEGRRIIGCDRISVGIRHGKKTTVEAVSAADVVEKSSTHIKRMRYLFDAVINWGEKLTYTGTRDETLPPDVLRALDDYLAESNPKMLVMVPLRDEREKAKETLQKKSRSAILMESFETPEKIEPLVNRLEVVSGHAAPALYNASEVKRIPLKFLWKPLGALQQGLGGKARFWTIVVLLGLLALTLAMIYVPYELKLEASGQLLPMERHYVFPQLEGQVMEFRVRPGQVINSQAPIATLRSSEITKTILELEGEILQIDDRIKGLKSQIQNATTASTQDAQSRIQDAQVKVLQDERKKQALTNLLAVYRKNWNADPSTPGLFTVMAPEFEPSRTSNQAPRWTVLTADFVDQLTYKTVRTSDHLIRIGNVSGAWLIEQKIPQKHIGQLIKAFEFLDNPEFLEVDVLLRSDPTRTFKGRLYRKDIAPEAVPNRDDHNQSDPIVYAYVTINHKDIDAGYHIPTDLLRTGAEVTTKIRCGKHSMGYSLFYGVSEWFYEHVIFFF
jgi:hypothetical protein